MFIIHESKGKYCFKLKARNGQTLCESMYYTSKLACLNGIEAVRKYSINAEIKDLTKDE